VLAFGPFRLDSDARRLLRRGEYVHLSRKAYDLLEYLVAARPRVLSKAELKERLWPGTFVLEANLSNLVSEIRSALEDDRRQPRFVRTVHGVGYAFCGEADDEAVPAESTGSPRDSLCWLICGDCRVQLREGEHLIGRHPASPLSIESPTVSRHHACIRVAGDEAVLTDLGSRNGTYVQGKRIEAPVALADGDEIRVGSIAFRFQVASLGRPTDQFPFPR
jgi:DNA-binding winged helix-turn-helix (wHTH) protein